MDDASGRAQTKPFAQFLQEINRGRLHAELSDELAAVIGAVVEHGRKGTLSVKLDIRPRGDDAIEVGVVYAAKAPQPPAQPAIFFADAGGRVSRERLDQPRLPLEGLDGGEAANA